MDEIECVVIGAGVVGLAIARALSLASREVIILEREECFGSGISSRSSEVIHAGLHYGAGSLKARFCTEGRDLLYKYCDAHAVAYKSCGKLIVATEQNQIPELTRIIAAGAENGVHNLRMLEASEALKLEPHLNCVAALISPSTGILDSHGFMLNLLGDAEDCGAVVAYGNAVSSLRVESDGILIFTNSSAPVLKARLVVNAAGLDAPQVTQVTDGIGSSHKHKAYYAKGNYFSLNGRSPFSRLIYPVPEPGGLGVHFTLDLGGQAKFGPDVEWLRAPDYSVDPTRAQRFYTAVRTYWPGLPEGALRPGYASVRPKLRGPGEPTADFLIEGPAHHGAPGLINLLGIESPGLTASLAIANYIANLAAESLDA